MLAAPLPGDEQARLLGLYALPLLDSEPDERFDRITRLAARMFDVPLAVVSVVDSDRLWFKSRTGTESDGTSRELSLSAHAILLQEPLVVPDLLKDPRFCDHPMVRASPGIRFYAGAPLRLRPGSAWGTLSILDRWPRNLASIDITMLRDLASLVIRELQLMEQASADGLTGLLSRTGFLLAAQQALSICDRIGAPAVLCGFRLTGREGRAGPDASRAADALRCQLASRLKHSFRGSDVLARTGSDTFAVLATHSQPSELLAALNRLGSAAGQGAVLHGDGADLRYRQVMVAHDVSAGGRIEPLLARVESLLDAPV